MNLRAACTVMVVLTGGVGAASAQEPAVYSVATGRGVTATPRIDAQNGVVEVAFPSDANPQTAWKIAWAVDPPRGRSVPYHGLYIREAWFKRENQPWLKVLGDCRVADLFVPYYKSPTNYFDISGGFTAPVPLTAEMGAAGQILNNKCVLEVRDRGVLWINEDPGNAQPRMRRGQEVTFWAPLKAGWYIYLFQYSFRDDGSIGFRSGSTGHNSPNEPHAAHMHNTVWRLDIDLGDPAVPDGINNSVFLAEHQEPPRGQRRNANQEFLVETPFNGGIEGGVPWNAERFTRLRIANSNTPPGGRKPISYDLIPLRSGTARHNENPKEDFTKNDFWVTPFAGSDGGRPKELEVFELPRRTQQLRRPIANADIVVWYTSSALHVPRQEDMLAPGLAVRDREGTTMLIWTGMDLVPRDLFQGSPHYALAARIPAPGVVPLADIQNFGPDALERILKEELRKEYKKEGKDSTFEFALKDSPLRVFINAKSKFLMFKAGDLPAAPLEAINEFNYRYAVHSRVYLDGGRVVFEVPIGYGGGINLETIRDYFALAELEHLVLSKHLASQHK